MERTEFQQRIAELKEQSERRHYDALRKKYAIAPDFSNMSLSEEIGIRYDLDELEQLKQKFGMTTDTPVDNALAARMNNQLIQQPAQYGNATARELDKYLENYIVPNGQVRTGLLAPIKDMIRNYDAMKEMKLKESDPFFHCKANYEAAKRGAYGTAVANIIDIGKELKDATKYPLSDSFRDYRANLRGQIGAWNGQTLQETCPTHHKYYR